jgi:RNA polymerase sigma-70 factor (ECF subfamily)
MRVSSEPEAESHPLLPDSPVWKTAYRKYRRFWLNLARGQQISEDQAKDILHTVLCSMMIDDRKQFTSEEHIRNYVARAILNRSVIARKESTRNLVWNETLEHLHPVLEDPDEEANSLREGIRDGLRSLSGTAFKIVKLRFYAGLTFQEVSQMLNMPMSTVKSREQAAIKKIRATLRKKGF